MIDCPNWLDCGVPHGGCCKANRYGGHPSLGTCGVCLTIQRTEQEAAAENAPSLLEKAGSFLRATASAVLSSLPDDEVEARLAACRGCEALKPLAPPQVGHCLACGCGESSLAELTVKARMPAATCPKKKWKVA